MLVRIMGRNREEKWAFAEEIKSYTLISAKDNTIIYEDKIGFNCFGDLRDIVRNPEICRTLVKGYYYKIKLPEGK